MRSFIYFLIVSIIMRNLLALDGVDPSQNESEFSDFSKYDFKCIEGENGP